MNREPTSAGPRPATSRGDKPGRAALRRQRNDSLQRSHERYRHIVEDQTEFICRYRADGRLSFVNGAYMRYYGKRRAELINRNFVPHIPEPDRTAIAAILAGITRANPVVVLEHRIITPGGETRWQRWTHRGIYLTDGRLSEYQAVGNDITERKRAEEEVRRVNAELRQANAEKDRYLTILAHDLCSPCSVFLGNIELLQLQLRSLPLDRVEQTVDRVHDSAQALYRLLTDLLAWSSMRQGLREFKPQREQLAAIIEQACRTCRESARSKDIAASLLVADDVYVEADRAMLVTVFRNLVTNAIKFTPNGGTVNVTVAPAGNMVIVTVADTGIGMKRDIIDRLFHSASGIQRRGTAGEPGACLGLLICEEFIQRHGGTIRATSSEGQGSAFQVTLPRAPGPGGCA